MSIAARHRPTQPFVEEVLKLLSNVLFPVVVFLIWAIATTIGTAVDQNQPPERYYEEYPVPVANLVLRLHLTNVFHSIPYISLIVLLLVSMSVCTFRRVIPKRFPKDRAVPIEKFALHAAQITAADSDGYALAARRYLERRGFAVRPQRIGDANWLFADKQKWARYGVLVAHLGFAVMALGVFLGWLAGYRGQLQIFSGQTVAVDRAAVLVTLKKFSAVFQPVQTPSGVTYQAAKFQSDVAVRDSGGIHPESILVNHPYLTPKKVYFYQASFGFAGRLAILRNGRPVSLPESDGRLMPGDGIDLPGTSRTIEYGTMLGPSDPSQLPAGLALPRRDEYALWIFHDKIPTTDKPILLPIGRSVDAGDGYVVSALPPLAWSGLTYRYDPGELWVGAGALILVGGFIMALFFVPVKLYARVQATAGGATLDLAATTTKGNAIYEEDFGALVNGLRDCVEIGGAAGAASVEAYA
ncbi:MAG: cytochrome c biogenesis protein ResB [Candidatus Eremiobacteraeota bacterium]|nr:cytochrome c biogenesis protein ResB [Candidatus Eremiobacteraeota bacterium]MBC5828523.1 cytochrome c biogenesis protein ResB [Candidatus Eremiobacteraeota bacterium]